MFGRKRRLERQRRAERELDLQWEADLKLKILEVMPPEGADLTDLRARLYSHSTFISYPQLRRAVMLMIQDRLLAVEDVVPDELVVRIPNSEHHELAVKILQAMGDGPKSFEFICAETLIDPDVVMHMIVWMAKRRLLSLVKTDERQLVLRRRAAA